MRKRLRSRRLHVAAGLAVIAAALAVSGTWAALGGGTAASTFFVTVDGETVMNVKSYAVDGAVGAGKKAPREYTIRLTLVLTDDAAPVQAFQNGQTFGSLKIRLFTASGEAVKTYEWANATVVGYGQKGDAASHTLDQDLVLTSTSLTVSA